MVSHIEQFLFFEGLIVLDGWAFDADNPIVAISLKVGELILPVPRYEHPVAPNHLAGLAMRQLVPLNAGTFRDPVLDFLHFDGQHSTLQNIGMAELGREHGSTSFERFRAMVRAMPPGNFLEIGGRARSGNTYHDKLIETGWQYTSIDIKAGENVDVVGDAHKMSQLLPHNHYNAVMSISVFEHLLMPWKVVVEMNRVLALGAVAFIMTHQMWPLHERPWDYWRMSSDAWPGLFNKYTGFRIIEATMAQPVLAVAKRWNMIANFGQDGGMAVSSVVVEKIAEATVDWPAELGEIVETHYPD